MTTRKSLILKGRKECVSNALEQNPSNPLKTKDFHVIGSIQLPVAHSLRESYEWVELLEQNE